MSDNGSAAQIGDRGESVADGLIATMSALPAELKKSLTWDQDVECCSPAWERGED